MDEDATVQEQIDYLAEQIEYLSTQMDRLVLLHHPDPGVRAPFRKACMLAALSFEQEIIANKVLDAAQGHPDLLEQGLVSVPEETRDMFHERAVDGVLSEDNRLAVLAPIVGGESTAQELLEAWKEIRENDEKNSRLGGCDE